MKKVEKSREQKFTDVLKILDFVINIAFGSILVINKKSLWFNSWGKK